jgi:hypothetical protein
VYSSTSPDRNERKPPVSPLATPTLRTIKPQATPNVRSTAWPGMSNVVEISTWLVALSVIASPLVAGNQAGSLAG